MRDILFFNVYLKFGLHTDWHFKDSCLQSPIWKTIFCKTEFLVCEMAQYLWTYSFLPIRFFSPSSEHGIILTPYTFFKQTFLLFWCSNNCLCLVFYNIHFYMINECTICTSEPQSYVVCRYIFVCISPELFRPEIRSYSSIFPNSRQVSMGQNRNTCKPGFLLQCFKSQNQKNW